jgi:dTDP-4-amino-4,6-dideoxygalactose transaminase
VISPCFQGLPVVDATIQNSLQALVRRHRLERPIYVTRPTLPDLADFRRRLEPVWASAWLTNDGALHEELRAALIDRLGVEHLSLCCNGTLALLLALQAAGIDGGEVITTPFTFPATPHSLHWSGAQPVFCDIEERSYTLDPEGIEKLIGSETRAILPVHVFGYPCDVEAIQAVADRHGLAVIYDAAHAMGVRYRGESILRWGDYSVLSFHATKLFSTAEGGAVVSRSESDRRRIDFSKNFGIADEETVIGPGINGKLNELQAAFGLLQLEGLEAEIANRERLTAIYRERLRAVPGISFQERPPDVHLNYASFTLLVDPDRYGMTRDELWQALKLFNVVTRRYFHPLCSRYPVYSTLPSARPENLPVAERVAERILCLPLYGTLEPEVVEKVCAIISELRHVR